MSQKKHKLKLCLIGILIFVSLVVSAADDVTLKDDDIQALSVCEGAIQLFSQMADSIWPGYDLSRQPFIYYMPDEWALLLNYQGAPDGFLGYPSNWPELPVKALYYPGQYRNLGGQLTFDFPIDDTTLIAAIPISSDQAGKQFGFTVHECFHQYQYHNFGEVPWQREEMYPMLDPENTALAVIEIKLLTEALKNSLVQNKSECFDRLMKFIAIRKYRWNRGDDYLALYEKGKELTEGTAMYVENKCLSLYPGLEYKSVFTKNGQSLMMSMSVKSFQEYLIEDFNSRFTGNSISPEDMPRNRIYPTACAQAYFLDYLGIVWQDKAQGAGESFDYSSLIKEYFNVPDDQLDKLANKIMTKYRYDELVKEANALIAEYEAGYQKAFGKFMAQNGDIIEIRLNSRGVRRSRSSSAKKWLVENGGIELRDHFRIYSLESDKLHLMVKESGVIEQNDWRHNQKKVVFFHPDLNTIVIDKISNNNIDVAEMNFSSIELNANNFEFSYRGNGSIIRDGNKISINLIEK